MLREQIVGLVNPLIALLFAGVFVALWFRTRQGPHLLAYAAGFALLAIGFLSFHLVADPSGAIATLVTHGSYSVACLLLVVGFCRRSERDVPTKILILSSVISTALLLLTGVADADANARMYIANANYGLIFALGSMALTGNAAKDPMNRMMIWMFGATAFQFFVRPTVSFILAGSLTTNDYRGSPYYSILVVTIALFTVALALCLIGSVFYDKVMSDRSKAERDLLSGLFMRKSFEERAITMLDRAGKAGVPVSMVVADIDYFKRVNDIWGHSAGDEAIASFGKLIADTIRDGDLAGRIGGEEFCVLVWDCPLQPAIGLADRIRRKFTGQRIDQLSPDTRLTASFGAGIWEPGESYGRFFARVDAALYRAKGDGRDCVRADGAAVEGEKIAGPVADKAVRASQPAVRASQPAAA